MLFKLLKKYQSVKCQAMETDVFFIDSDCELLAGNIDIELGLL
jgi:hypothetical protein